MKASEVGLLTWEASVSCGQWCQGGSVHMTPTMYPQHEDAEFVWVRGDIAGAEITRLRDAIERAGRCLVMSNDGAAAALAILRAAKRAADQPSDAAKHGENDAAT